MDCLAVLGSTTRDIVGGGPVRPGGAPLYAAQALALLGAKARVVTRCAADDEQLLDPLRAFGLPVTWRPASATPAFRLADRDDDREFWLDTLAEPWAADRWLEEAVGGAAMVQVGALYRGEFPLATLAALRRGRRVCLDAQGLLRPGRVGKVVLDTAFDPAVLAAVDVLHVSESELRVLGVGLDPGELGRVGVGEIVVTLGERGCAVWADGRVERVGVDPLAGIDATGAGDRFTAAYLACRLGGATAREAAERATATVRRLLGGTST